MKISLLGLRIKENREKEHRLQSAEFSVANVVLFMSIIVTETLFILKKIQVTTESYDLSGGFDPAVRPTKRFSAI